MSDFYFFEGPDLDEVIDKALNKLGIDENNVEIEIVQEGNDGFLGFGKKNYKIKVIPLISIQKKNTRKGENIDDIVNKIEEKNVNQSLMGIDKTKEGIYLTLYSGKKGDLEDVQKIIDENGVVNVDYEGVKTFLETDAERVKIAEYDPDIYIDSEINIEVSDDEMQAFITVTEPQGGNPPSKDDIMAALDSEGVVFGIKDSALNEILKDKKYEEKILIAEGLPTASGKDAYMDLKVNLDKDVKPQLLEDGKVDFKSLNIITNVVKGEVLGEYVPPTQGENGKDVLGNEIDSEPGEEITIDSFAGKNVEVSDDGEKLISQIDGQIIKEGDKITVTAVYVIDGDVDLNVGNIDFIGSVVVKGSVLDGFNIKAKGNVEVEKTIGSCEIEATGDIIVKGGIMGKDIGKVKAGNNIVVKFIENSNVSALNNIIVSRAVMHSHISCNKINVMEGKGLIVGGVIKAQEEVECKILGSHLATKTAIIIGIKEEIMKRIEDIDNEVSHIYDDIDKVNEAVEVLDNLKQRLKQLPEDKEQKLKKYSSLIEQLEEKSETLMNERDRLEEEIEGSQGGRLKVKDKIFPGVTITIRKGVMQVKDEIKFASIIYEEGYLKINPYS